MNYEEGDTYKLRKKIKSIFYRQKFNMYINLIVRYRQIYTDQICYTKVFIKLKSSVNWIEYRIEYSL